jgi:GcrA cell cycle regulator
VIIATEHLQRLRQLWAAGLSAIECGAEIGLVGPALDIRESVLRALEKDAPKSGPKPRPPRVKAPPRVENRSAKPKAVEFVDDAEPMFKSDGIDGKPAPADLEIPIEQRKTLLQLTASTCRWPVGEPKESTFFFCGGAARDGEPYCTHHCRRAYGNSLSRRRAA